MKGDTYSIVLKRSVLKDIRKIPAVILERIRTRITTLSEDPHPAGAEVIQGYLHHYRIRIGDYRVLYEVTDRIRIVTIIRIGHRSKIYRNL